MQPPTGWYRRAALAWLTRGGDGGALGVGDGAGEVCVGGVVPVGCGAGDVVCRGGL